MSHFFSNFVKELFTKPEDVSTQETLLSTIQSNFPDKKQEDILLIYCVAGLLTRVAYSDLIITDDEQQAMVTHLTKWSKIDHSIATQVMQIASQQMILLSGIENHKYCSPLITLLVESERYALLETLFHIANSDGETSPTEQEEIRSITIGLGLPHRYFTAARAKVMNLA